MYLLDIPDIPDYLYHLGTYQVDSQCRHLDCYHIFRDRCEVTKQKKIKRQIRMEEPNRLKIFNINTAHKKKKEDPSMSYILSYHLSHTAAPSIVVVSPNLHWRHCVTSGSLLLRAVSNGHFKHPFPKVPAPHR